MKELIIITDAYPWGKGEKSFLTPELPYLQKEFKLTILSRAPQKWLAKDRVDVDESIDVIHYLEPEFGRKEMLRYIPLALFSKELREEMHLVKKSKAGKECIRETYVFWIRAVKFHKWMQKNGIFDNCENKLFYSYWANHSTLSLSMEKRKNKSIKFVSRAHRYDLYNEAAHGGRQPFKTYIDKWVDKMIFIAKEGLDYYLEHFAVNKTEEDKYELRKLGVETPTVYPKKENKTVFRLVSCSSVDKRKRVNLIVDALAKLEYPIEWHHFGDGPDMDELRKQTQRQLDKKDNIDYILHGHVVNKDVLHFYQEHWVDGFITTSSSEGSPVSMQEAMAYGVPVIGTAVGEIPFMIRECGILLSEDPTVEDVREAIYKLCKTEEKEMEHLRQNAAKVWEEDYRLEINATEFVNTLVNI